MVVGNGRMQIKQQPDDVLVMHYTHLTRFILELPAVLHPDALTRILLTARRSDSWLRPQPRRAAR
ncbi:hypothetical protein G7085_08870 [Tessaracoccus sp. HDW20]|uniref:hypothetical protein n=1 Tax=Tessaracoccus coleopterorum TaxID=2714950 RepID=UPI0018D38247|nr:hypothetical protein [Tessaracoccus coleopterorum]NHB84683.1 hypothetical protein [Tessaracoccus coleopterorum]